MASEEGAILSVSIPKMPLVKVKNRCRVEVLRRIIISLKHLRSGHRFKIYCTIEPTSSSSSLGTRPMPSLKDTSYTPFRLAERHFKDRAVKDCLPTLHQQNIIDLSRPEQQEEDEVWQAGWWAPSEAISRRSRKGKERKRGERPEFTVNPELKRVKLDNGLEGWVVAEGKES